MPLIIQPEILAIQEALNSPMLPPHWKDVLRRACQYNPTLEAAHAAQIKTLLDGRVTATERSAEEWATTPTRPT
jgi:hypothetical protein